MNIAPDCRLNHAPACRPQLTPDCRLHHIGVVTRGIDKELPFFESLGYQSVSSVFTEPGQKVRGLFIAAPGQPTLELLENLGPSGPLDTPLARGIKLYHFAYATDDIEAALAAITADGRAKIISPLTGGAYFSRLCFVMLPNMMLIELVEMPGHHHPDNETPDRSGE